MSNLSELRNERLKKLAELKKLGIDPYPAKSNRTLMAGSIRTDFER